MFQRILSFVTLSIFLKTQIGQGQIPRFVEVNSNRDLRGSVAWKCLNPTNVYYPDDKTTCVCIGILVAECKTNAVTSTRKPASGDSSPLTLHPLDPLTGNEILKAKRIIENSNINLDLIYNWVTLKEPPKADLLPYFLNDVDPPRGAFERKAFIVFIEKGTGQVYEALVNLDSKRVESFIPMPVGHQPTRTPDDDAHATAIVKANPVVQHRCRQLGYPNMSLVYTAPWPMGYAEDRPEYSDLKRPYNVYMYGRNFEDDNPFAHPFDFIVIADIIEERVVAIEELPTHDDTDTENKDGNFVPREPSNFDYRLKNSNFLRHDDKPIKVSSPEGPSYKVKGNAIEWQNFKMRIGFNGREGLIIYNVVYNDKGIIRPILYRASLAEVGISYSDPRPPFHRKLAFDEGQNGLGFASNELTDQEHCIGETRYFNGIINNNTGHAKTIKNAICITEEDAGMLWHHLDGRTGKWVIVRSHRLSISFIVTAGNYDFGFRWMFYQDASIQFQAQLTGILNTNMLALKATPAGYGTTVFPQVDAQYHQHYFALRLDTEIDGNENSVFTSEAVALEGGTGSVGNPYGQGFTNKRRLLRTAAEGRTNTSPSTGRVWIVSNPNSKHPFSDKPGGWKLMPAVCPPLLIKKDSPIFPKVAFMEYDVWVTRYEEGQLYPGGFYLNNSGLPEWVGNDPDAPIENSDVVLWHMFGHTHVPRVEDFPVMPFEDLNVWLRPYNFFLENPSLDVPPTSVKRLKDEF